MRMRCTDDTTTSPLFSHYMNLSKGQSASSKSASGVDMTAYNKMMKNFDK